MRIAMFTNVYPPLVGGVAVSVETFRRELSRHGHLVSVFAPSVDGVEKERATDEPFVFRLRALDLSQPLNVALPLVFKAEIMPILNGFKPDVIHSHHPYFIGDLAAKCARELGRPLVFTYHTTYLEHAALYVRRASRLAAQLMTEVLQNYIDRCDHLVAPTPTIRDDIHQYFRLSCPVSVIPTPVDLEPPASEPRPVLRRALGLEDRLALIYVGRLSVEKSVEVLLAAFAKVRAKVPPAHLILLGGGPGGRETQRLIRAYGLEAAVVLTGSLPRSEVARYLAASDVFVIASKTETQGLAIVEAMAAGLPVVAVRAAGTIDVVTDGAGCLVPPDDPSAFAEAVVELLRNPALRKRMSAAGRQVAARYNSDGAIEQVVRLYEEVVGACVLLPT